MNRGTSDMHPLGRVALLLVGLAVVTLLVWTLPPGAKRGAAAKSAEQLVGAVAPDFTLKAIDGK